MKLHQLIVILLVAYILPASAQTSRSRVSGKVVDGATGKPIEFASVLLIQKAATRGKPGQTNMQGIFSINDVANGSYTLKINFVGYRTYEREGLVISGNKTTDLGTIKLVRGEATALKEVVVEGRRNNIELGVDRKVFNVEQSLVSEGGSATDLLANVPTVSVDIDGNVSLRGSGSVRVLIDGKPSAIGGGDIASVLQALPASSIETIELITNPSAKYDPEGQTGIINIVLKKNKKIGINGAVSLSAGTQENYNANTTLSYRDKKINIYGNYSYRYGNRLGGGFNNTRFLSNSGIVNNAIDAKRRSTGNTAKAGFDYYLNEKTTIGISANINGRDGLRTEDINYFYQNYSAALDGNSFRTSREDDKDTGYDLSLDFSRKFKRQGEELSANFSAGRSKEDEFQNLNQDFFTSSGLKRDTVDIRSNDGDEASRNYNVQLDYTLPFSKKQKLEAGYRSTFRIEDASQFSRKFDLEQNMMITDFNQTNDFNLEDIVHAVYGSYQNQLTDKFGFQLGLRAEQAYLNTEYIGTDTSTMNKVSTPAKLDYFRVYPSVFLTQKLGGQQQLQLSYTRRVNRPRGWQVNPFRDLSDPNNIRVGNPGLRPEDVHAFELSYMKYFNQFTLTSSVYFRQVNDVVESIQQVIDSTTTLSRFINLSRNQATGLEVIGRADLSKGFNITGNVNFFYNKFFGSESYGIESNSGYNWTSSLIANAQLPKNLSAQVNGFYMAPRVSAQGERKAIYGVDAALRLDVLKKKGSISFNMRDVFNTRRYGFVTETNQLYRQSERRFQGRMSTLTFSYRFGKSDLPQRKKMDRNNNGDPGDSPEDAF